jgi:lauroyl/myristoyl acyltransferase
MSVLAENGVVTIVGDLSTGRRVHPVTVNRETVPLANGGARLSCKTGAALLPVTLSRTGPLRYRVDILEPLIAPDGLGTDKAVVSLIEQFAEILADFVRRDPAQWPKWRGPTS